MHEAPYSAADLEPTFHRIIFDDQDFWRARGLPVVQAWIGHEGTYIEIGTPDPARAGTRVPATLSGRPFCFFEQAGGSVPFGDRSG